MNGTRRNRTAQAAGSAIHRGTPACLCVRVIGMNSVLFGISALIRGNRTREAVLLQNRLALIR